MPAFNDLPFNFINDAGFQQLMQFVEPCQKYLVRST